MFVDKKKQDEVEEVHLDLDVPETEEVANETVSDEVVQKPANACPHCEGGLIGDPTGINKVCTFCRGRGVK